MAHLEAARRRLLRSLADILDYPVPGLTEKASQCEELTSREAPAARPLVRAFLDFAKETPPGHLEEIYTGFFDLNPVCSPYVGYHLFGDSYKRSAFLLALQERYRAEGFEFSPVELADRLSIVLRFIADSTDEHGSRELVVEGVIPALLRMRGAAHGQDDAGPAAVASSNESSPQLEGHSEGEILAGGFLLETTAGAATSNRAQQAYRCALEAARLVLEECWPPCAAVPAAEAVGGRRNS